MDKDLLKKIVSRRRNLHRAFNITRSLRRHDERAPHDDWKHRFPEMGQDLLTKYYYFKGWNYDGVPTREILEALDLSHIAKDLEKRGFLKDGMVKIKKTIKINSDKCNGCRACEVVCSAVHSKPKYSSINPVAFCIHVITRRLDNIWLPVFAGEYIPAECNGRDKYVIDGKEYDEYGFCRASGPSRNMFKEPDTSLPLKCDMCEGEEAPLCVEWCLNDVLIFEEREEEVEEEIEMDELEVGLDSLIENMYWIS